jgi:hypothetical protein
MGEAVKVIILGTEGEFIIELPAGVKCDTIIEFLKNF